MRRTALALTAAALTLAAATSTAQAHDSPPTSQTPPTTSSETVLLCIQGHTVEGHRGSANPNGYPYHEGPCNEPPASTTSTTAVRRVPPPAVKARPRFTG